MYKSLLVIVGVDLSALIRGVKDLMISHENSFRLEEVPISNVQGIPNI